MSCPSWFPKEYLLSAPYRAMMEVFHVIAVVGGPHHLFPVPGWPMALSGSIDAGFYLADNECSSQHAMCDWMRRTRRDIAAVVDSNWGELAQAIPVIASGVGAAFAELRSFDAKLAYAQHLADCDDLSDLDGASMDDDLTIAPMFTWTRGGLPPGNPLANVNDTANTYSHAYKDAAEEAYAVDPRVNLRPWLLAQSAVDAAYVRQQLTFAINQMAFGRTPRHIRIVDALQETLRGLDNWNEAAASSPPGAWSRSTLRRVLNTRNLQTNLPVEPEVPDVQPPVEQDDEGGGGAGFAVALGVLGLLAAAR